MPKRVTDYEIRCALDRGLPLQVVADEYGLPIRRVARIESSGRSAHDEKRPLLPGVGMRLTKGVILASAPSPATAPYWTALNPIRSEYQPRMVPDDRSDEFDFDDLLDVMATAVSVLGQRGRGVA